jgi:hypothetical protein
MDGSGAGAQAPLEAPAAGGAGVPAGAPAAASPRTRARALPPMTLPVKVSLAALAQKLLQQRDLQPRANGLRTDHPLRALAIAVCTSPAFDTACMLVIFANCALLAIYDPLDKTDSGARNKAMAGAEDCFQALFSLEMALKVLAFGWLGTGPSGARVGYLADPWNWMDGLIVLVGFVFYSRDITSSTSTISALRTVRVLRPLKNLNSVPSMRLVVKSVLAALPSLANVIILLLFSLLLVAIVGLMLWPGVLAGQCAYLDPVSGGSVLTGAFCALSCDAQDAVSCTPTRGDQCSPALVRFDLYAQLLAQNATLHSATLSARNLTSAAENFTVAALDTACTAAANPGKGLVSFDDIGHAVLTIFTGITTEGWTDTMYALGRTWGYAPAVSIYWVLTILFCTFFVMQLSLAVVYDSFVESQAREESEADALLAEHAGMLLQHLRAAKSSPQCRQAVRRLWCGGQRPHAIVGQRAEAAPEAAAEAAGSSSSSSSGGEGGASPAPASPAPASPTPTSPAPASPTPSKLSDLKALTAFLYVPTVVVEHPLLYPALADITTLPAFNNSMTFLIVLNTLQLAMPYAGMSDAYKEGLEYANFFFTGCFGVELLLKLCGEGPRRYFSDSFNIFDCAVVLLSFLDIAMTQAKLDGGGGLGALRTFRLARVFKLAKKWPALRHIITTLLKNMPNFQAALSVLGLVIFIFTLLCMQLFGGGFPEGDVPRANYDTLWLSAVSVFQTASGENWNQQLQDGNAVFGPVYIVVLFVIQFVCAMIFLNLFMAILLSAFEEADELDEEEAEEEEEAAAEAGGAASPKAAAALDDDHAVNSRLSHAPSGSAECMSTTVQASAGQAVELTILSSGAVSIDAGERAQLAGKSPLEAAFFKLGVESAPAAPGGAFAWLQYSHFLLSPASALRQAAVRLAAHPHFDNFILLVIVVSSINLALDEPRVDACKELPAADPSSCAGLFGWLFYSDFVITAIFVAELLVKVVAMGWAGAPGSYLHNSWNVLDCAIVCVSVASLAVTGSASTDLKVLKAIRAMRALRPLRAVSLFPGLKLVVDAVLGALPKAFTVMVINLLFFVLLAVVGLQNWMGVLAACNDGSVGSAAECTGTWTLLGGDCALLPTLELEAACRRSPAGAEFPRLWAPLTRNFDNIFNSLLTTYEVADGEGWPNIMWPVVDAPSSPGLPAIRDNSPAAALWFIVVQIVLGAFLLELFTGMIIDYYNHLKEHSEGAGLLTPEQQVWVRESKMILAVSPSVGLLPPTRGLGSAGGGGGAAAALLRLRRRLFALVQAPQFEWAIMAVILANTAILASYHSSQSAAWREGLTVANNVCAAVFIAEAAAKLAALGLQYFLVPWNIFDLLLVLGSVLGWVLTVGPVTTILRVLRVARIFRLVRMNRGLLVLFRTLILSLPALFNVGVVLVIVFFIFTVVGMNIFSGTRYSAAAFGSTSVAAGSGSLGPNANFDSFWGTALTLFRCSTGEDWNGLMHSLRIQPPYCAGDNCGDLHRPPIYFFLFNLSTAMILMKLLVAVVMDTFGALLSLEKEAEAQFKVTPDTLEAFTEAWAECDPSASRFLYFQGLVKLVGLLPHPLGSRAAPGLAGLSPRAAAFAVLSELALQAPASRRFQFHLVLGKMVHRANRVARGQPSAAVDGARAPLSPRAQGVDGALEYLLLHNVAACRIQRLIRNKAGRVRSLPVVAALVAAKVARGAK